MAEEKLEKVDRLRKNGCDYPKKESTPPRSTRFSVSKVSRASSQKQLLSLNNKSPKLLPHTAPMCFCARVWSSFASMCFDTFWLLTEAKFLMFCFHSSRRSCKRSPCYITGLQLDIKENGAACSQFTLHA